MKTAQDKTKVSSAFLAFVVAAAGGVAYIVSCGVAPEMATYRQGDPLKARALELASALERHPSCYQLRRSVAEIRHGLQGYGGYSSYPSLPVYPGYASQG